MLYIGARLSLLHSPRQQIVIPPIGVWGATNSDTVLLDADTVVTITGSSSAARSTSFANAGIKQFEVFIISGSIPVIAVAREEQYLVGSSWPYGNSWLCMSDGTTRSPYSSWGSGPTFPAFGHAMGVVIDFSVGTMKLYKNGVLQGLLFTTLSGESVAPMVANANAATASYKLRTRDFLFPVDGATNWV